MQVVGDQVWLWECDVSGWPLHRPHPLCNHGPLVQVCRTADELSEGSNDGNVTEPEVRPIAINMIQLNTDFGNRPKDVVRCVVDALHVTHLEVNIDSTNCPLLLYTPIRELLLGAASMCESLWVNDHRELSLPETTSAEHPAEFWRTNTREDQQFCRNAAVDGLLNEVTRAVKHATHIAWTNSCLEDNVHREPWGFRESMREKRHGYACPFGHWNVASHVTVLDLSAAVVSWNKISPDQWFSSHLTELKLGSFIGGYSVPRSVLAKVGWGVRLVDYVCA